MTVVLGVVSAFVNVSARGAVACKTCFALAVKAAHCVYAGRSSSVAIVLATVRAFIHVSARVAVACKA